MNTAEPGFKTLTPTQLTEPLPQQAWLIEQLWHTEACGIIGGEPKSGKTFLALSMAVAVASGQPCLNRFTIQHPAAVVLYSAEHHTTSLRQRIHAIAAHTQAPFDQLPIHIIPASAEIRLDFEHHRTQLSCTVARINPALLILDPFTRLHHINENLTHEVAPLLDYLRILQQRYNTAVALVHHCRKTTAERPGQSLRGTSDLHAWGDSNLYLTTHANHHINLLAEHRNAASNTKVQLALKNAAAGTALHIVG